MTDFTMTEIDAQHVELLPAKETLWAFNFGTQNWANVYATNSSIALNAVTAFSSATSTATQGVIVMQGG